MCGIAGYIGNGNVGKKLVYYLGKLEYRGYDSAGVAVVMPRGEISAIKRAGEVKILKAAIREDGAKTGIAHTRWATHGRADEVNAHPHLSPDRSWAVVHNGIIENYAELKERFFAGEEFISRTDSEIIPRLLGRFAKGKTMAEFMECARLLAGSFAVAAVAEGKDEIFLAKEKSPLYVAKKGTFLTVSSDPICFEGEYEEYFSLLDGEYAHCSEKGIEFYGRDGGIAEKKPIRLADIPRAVQPDESGHFMLKEIGEIPRLLESAAANCDRYPAALRAENFDNVKLIGCGTAYNAARFGADVISRFLNVECEAIIASEFDAVYRKIDRRTLVVAVSQSGETADTVRAAKIAREKGALIVGLTDALQSSLAAVCREIIPVHSGREVAVASTKAYVMQLVALYRLSRVLAGKSALFPTLSLFSDKKKEEDAAELLSRSNDIFLLGRGRDYVTAREAALKIKEITYANANAYAAGELKHGFIALIDENSTCVFFITQRDLVKKALCAVEEVSARKGKIIIFTCFALPSVPEGVMQVLTLPDNGDELNPISAIIPWQKIAYRAAVLKGLNPDKPRNLAKSVTVE